MMSLKVSLKLLKRGSNKAMNAKKEAFQYYNDLKKKEEMTGFKPIVTRAKLGSENIFQHRKQNYNDDDDEGIIFEEDDELFDEDNTFKNQEKQSLAKHKSAEAEVTPLKAKSENKSLKTPKNKSLTKLWEKNTPQKILDESKDIIETTQNIHFMQIKSISKNFQAPVVDRDMINEEEELKEESSEEDEEGKRGFSSQGFSFQARNMH